MKIAFDPAKRDWTLRERGLDFAEADQVFVGATLERADNQRDYGELRMVTVGYLRERMVIICWTPRGETRHVISMRKANEREQAKYSGELQARR